MSDVNSPGATKGSPLLAVLIVGMVIIAALLGVIVILLLGRGDGDAETSRSLTDTTEQRAVVVNEDNVEETLEEIVNEPPVAMGYYEVNMNLSWTFPDAQSPSSNAYVENKATNTSAVYFDVLLEEDESIVLYESPILPVGTHINEVTLAQDLDAGTYPCVIVYHLLDDQQRTTSTLRLNLEIVVNS
jgi:hypothetical protein